MGKSLDWVREEPTGRLIFRRAYPEAIRDFLPKTGQRELKVPLRAKRYMTPEAFRLYDQAIKRFEADVRHAIAAQAVEGRKATGTVEPITWTAMPSYKPDAPLRPAGLIGPITIKASR